MRNVLVKRDLGHATELGSCLLQPQVLVENS